MNRLISLKKTFDSIAIERGWTRLVAMMVAASVMLGISQAEAREQIPLGTVGWHLWLDRKAEWKNDELFLLPADLAKLPVKAPSCGWGQLFSKTLPAAQVGKALSDDSFALTVQVPGTVEEFCWDALSGDGKGLGTSGNYVGVSWWGKEFVVPAGAKGKRVKLFFSEGIRQRAEVFVNEKLVGYELVHQTSFEIDVTDAVRFGATNKLAVRITDSSGNFSWGDYIGEEWGKYFFPVSHGFGGILGEVELGIVEPVHISDVFVKNKPTLTNVDLEIEIANDGKAPLHGVAEVKIVEAWQHNAPVVNPATIFEMKAGEFAAEAGKKAVVNLSASVPMAKLWGIQDANLYNAVVTLKDSNGTVLDEYKQRFGFRFLSVEGVGSDPRFYLNNQRTFLLSSISWGYWPTNGIFPTRELARKHITSAQALGQNMLNFHRCQGNSLVLDLADEMGMLYYEEPGGYSSSRIKESNPLFGKLGDFSLAQQLNSQRLLRMVKRDRNHPSLVIYNMVNEPGWEPDEQAKKDMAEAHRLDPTRFISYGSGFTDLGKDQPRKLHMLPYDQTQKTLGYCDVHNAGNAAGVYIDSIYSSPTNFRRNEQNKQELFVWGEEGAIASPPQLELIQGDIAKVGYNGWDGADYKNWYNVYIRYIKEKGLDSYYPSLTKLITSLGDIMYYEHGRLVENARIADHASLYVLNGYEDMKLDNFSGAVDVFRNLKGTPELISQYLRPLYVAVKAREKIGHVGDTNLVDLFLVNQQVIASGDYTVKASVKRPDGVVKTLFSGPVHVRGGDCFSEFVTEKVPVAMDGGNGYYQITAELTDASGKRLGDGREELFAVDWKSDHIPGKGAVLGGGAEILRFAKEVKNADIEPYAPSLGKLDYILVGSIDQGKVFKPVSSFNFRALDGKTFGLNLEYYRGKAFEQQVDRRISTAPIDFDTKSKLIPGYDILGETDFSLRWEGTLVPDHSGLTQFEFTWDDGARVWFDGKLVVDSWKSGPANMAVFEHHLEAGKAYSIRIEAFQAGGGWGIGLKWKRSVPDETPDIASLIKRVRQDGTKLILMEGAEAWLGALQPFKVLPDYKIFHPAKAWVGHNFFVRQHPFFEGLPVNGGMNWEYQRLVVYDGPSHFGLYDMTGEEAVVSLVGGASQLVSTAVGIIPCGKGQIAFSALDLAPNLMLDQKAANVPKKIFCNYLKWAAGESSENNNHAPLKTR